MGYGGGRQRPRQCFSAKVILCNFIDPTILRQSSDITTITYEDLSAQLKDSELAIGTSTRMLMCGELEDEVVGTVIETQFYKSVCTKPQ